MAKKYIININQYEWDIIESSWNYKTKNSFRGFDPIDEIPDQINFGLFNFMHGMPVYLYDPFIIREETIKELEKIDVFNIKYDFIAYNDTDMENKKKISEFEGTFIDAFKFINKHKELLNL